MLRLSPTPLIFALIALSGVIDGLWTNRWIVAEEIHTAANKLTAVPLTLGDWEGQALELDARTISVGEISGYVRRQYTHRRTGSTISLLIVCGRPGPVSVHPPEACYRGAGYEEVSGRTKYSEPGPPAADFWVYRFHKPDSAVPLQLRVFCSWFAAGGWRAVEAPRVEFAHHAVLYKMYVIRELPKADELLQDDPTLDFLRVALPELQKSLSPSG